MGGSSYSRNRSNQTSNQSSVQAGGSSQNVWGEQAQYLSDLYGMGSNIAQEQMPQIGQDAARFSSDLYSRGSSAYDTLQSFAGGNNPIQQALFSRAESGNPYLENVIGSLRSDINTNLGEQLNAINTQAGGAGVRGGSRSQLAMGEAARGASDAFARGAGDIRYQDYGAGTDILQGLGESQLGAADMARSGLGDMFNLGMSPYQSQWGPLSALAGIIGGPQVLSDSWSRGLSQGTSSGASSGISTGISFL